VCHSFRSAADRASSHITACRRPLGWSASAAAAAAAVNHYWLAIAAEAAATSSLHQTN